MNLTEYIISNKRKISLHLKDFMLKKKEQFIHEPDTVIALNKIEQFSQKGKMLRGILLILSYEIFSRKPLTDDILDLAVALELTQSGALIHDDIMDNDHIRRGEKTIFAQYAEEAEVLHVKSSLFYGQGMGLCVGDLSFFLAFELIGRHQHNNGLTDAYTLLFQKCISGQLYDFILGQSSKEATKEEILTMYFNKTGSYSIVLPLLLGARAAQAPEDSQDILEEIGEAVGIIFQIKDDQLGLLENEEEIGKPQGSDIREDKKTLVRLLLYTSASLADRKELQTIFGNENIKKHAINKILFLYKKYAIEKQINQIISDYSNKIPSLISKLPDIQATEILKEFINYNVSRKS